VLREPLQICRARAQWREREPLAKPKVVERLWQNFTDLGELERNVLDLEGRSPEEAAGMLTQGLAGGLLTL